MLPPIPEFIPPLVKTVCYGESPGQALHSQEPITGASAEVLAVDESDNVRLVKIARSGMLMFRRKLHKEQGGLCPLCGKEIDLRIKSEGVIDHDHDTGRVRGLLHRSCNAAEGKVANAAGRWGAKSTKYKDIIPFLAAMVIYLQQPQSRYVYPYHKTPEELLLDKRKKARVNSANARARKRMQEAKQ